MEATMRLADSVIAELELEARVHSAGAGADPRRQAGVAPPPEVDVVGGTRASHRRHPGRSGEDRLDGHRGGPWIRDSGARQQGRDPRDIEQRPTGSAEFLQSLDDERSQATWTMIRGGKTLMAIPRIDLIRDGHAPARRTTTAASFVSISACWTCRCPPSTGRRRTKTPSPEEVAPRRQNPAGDLPVCAVEVMPAGHQPGREVARNLAAPAVGLVGAVHAQHAQAAEALISGTVALRPAAWIRRKSGTRATAVQDRDGAREEGHREQRSQAFASRLSLGTHDRKLAPSPRLTFGICSGTVDATAPRLAPCGVQSSNRSWPP